MLMAEFLGSRRVSGVMDNALWPCSGNGACNYTRNKRLAYLSVHYGRVGSSGSARLDKHFQPV